MITLPTVCKKPTDLFMLTAELVILWAYDNVFRHTYISDVEIKISSFFAILQEIDWFVKKLFALKLKGLFCYQCKNDVRKVPSIFNIGKTLQFCHSVYYKLWAMRQM